MTRRIFTIVLLLAAAAAAQSQKWSEEKANEWYSRQPWLVGSNYLPVYAVNQLEMWSAEYVRCRPDQFRIRLGGKYRDEYHAGLPA